MNGPTTHFLHIGKTGGTALRIALAPLGGERLVFHQHEVGLQQIPPGDRAIFSVRDPIDRFVSGFYSRRRKGRPRLNNEWSDEEKTAFCRFETPNVLAQALSSNDPDEAHAAERAMNAIGHVRRSLADCLGSCDYLEQRRVSIAYIAHQPELDEDFERIKQLLGLPGAVLPSDPLNRHENPPGLDLGLSELAAANLGHWFKREFPLYRSCLALRRQIIAEGFVSSNVPPTLAV